MKLYCPYCAKDKDIDEFHRKHDAPYGRNGKCKSCKAEYDRHRRELHPEKFKLWKKQWIENNLEHKRAYDREYNKRRVEARIWNLITTRVQK